jgi:two-component system, NarL family, nitrate/nitrite response regulator NarL
MSGAQDGDARGKPTEARGEREVPRPRRILIADDHAAFRLFLRAEIEAAGLGVCAEAGSAEETVTVARAWHPELCLLDVNMHGSGIDAARAILDSVSETNVILLTASVDFDDFLAAVGAGIQGYLRKDIELARLSYALREVLAGGVVYPHAFEARLLERL